MYLFGLLGIVSFFGLLVIALQKSFAYRCHSPYMLFCFTFLFFYAIVMIFDGRGSDLIYFSVLGILSGLLINDNKSVFGSLNQKFGRPNE